MFLHVSANSWLLVVALKRKRAPPHLLRKRKPRHLLMLTRRRKHKPGHLLELVNVILGTCYVNVKANSQQKGPIINRNNIN